MRPTMSDLRTRVWLGPTCALALGCSGETPTPEGSDPAQGSPRACPVQWGTIGMPWVEGTSVIRSYGFPRLNPYLNANPDAIRATTSDGRTLSCIKTFTGYDCNDPAGKLKTITVTLAGQSWSWPATCSPYAEEDPVRLDLHDAKPCIAAGSRVVEGELLHYDDTRPTPVVTLEGPWQVFDGSTGAPEFLGTGHVPGVRCEVTDGYYRCPTLGFRTSTVHTVVAGGIRTEVTLPVEDCKVESVRLDIPCTTAPTGMYIETPEPDRDQGGSDAIATLFTLSASYEGGPSYPCRRASEAPYDHAGPAWPDSPAVYFCPAAAGSEYGRGRYEIVAAFVFGLSPTYHASVSDAFDGCGGLAAPLEWHRD
jgi:hypothetical protein